MFGDWIPDGGTGPRSAGRAAGGGPSSKKIGILITNPYCEGAQRREAPRDVIIDRRDANGPFVVNPYCRGTQGQERTLHVTLNQRDVEAGFVMNPYCKSSPTAPEPPSR